MELTHNPVEVQKIEHLCPLAWRPKHQRTEHWQFWIVHRLARGRSLFHPIHGVNIRKVIGAVVVR